MRILLIVSFFAQPVFAIIEDATVTLTDRTPVSLRGFWRFSAPGISKPLRVDKEWRLQEIENVATAHYALRIRIAPEAKNGDFGLILPPMSAALKIRFNNHLVAEKGQVSPFFMFPQNSSEAFDWYPIKREFLVPGEEQELDLEITGFQGGGGAYGNAHFYFGGMEEIRAKYNRIFLTTAFLAAAIFMIALFHFALVSDRNYRRANLHYVLLSLAMSCHILGINGLGYYLVNDFLFNAALIHLIIAAFPFALVGFSLRYFHLRFPLIRRAAYWYGGVMSLVLLATAVFPPLIPYYLKYGLPAGVTVMGLALAFAVFASVRGVMQHVEGAWIVLLGFIIYAAAVINDITFYFSYAISLKLAEMGFLAAVVCIALALAARLQRFAQEREELRDWQKEISLAAQIQRLALPRHSLDTGKLRIRTLFKPMKIIGGDFFAFHEISPEVTGVFIADVSGHGVAAALLVNTINSIFMQQREHAEYPAQLMQNMNTALYPHLGEQFVTAAYCVIDFAAGKIRIAQAGHPPIYLLDRHAGALTRAKPKGRFFGFDAQLQFETAEFSLSDYRRIFLYSDGVIEAGALHSQPYSVQRLEHFLSASAAKDTGEVLSALESDIVSYTRHAMNTDDDSSCVLVDLLVA